MRLSLFLVVRIAGNLKLFKVGCPHGKVETSTDGHCSKVFHQSGGFSRR